MGLLINRHYRFVAARFVLEGQVVRLVEDDLYEIKGRNGEINLVNLRNNDDLDVERIPKVLSCEVDSDRINIFLDQEPLRWDEMEFEVDKRGCHWFAERDGFVNFFYWKGPENNGGYGGGSFDILMKDGKDVKLLGPYSSNSGSMNVKGFIPSKEVMFHWVGAESRSGKMTVAVIQSLINNQGWELIHDEFDVYRIYPKAK